MPSPKAKNILAKFRSAVSQRQPKDKIWAELDKFDRGEQWKNENIPEWVPRPVTNYIHLVKTTKRAALAIQNPTGKLRALSPEDIEKVEELQHAYEDTWRRAGTRAVVRDCIETGKLLGTAIAQVYFDDEPIIGGTGGLAEGIIRVKQIDPSSFYPDPTAYRLDDCQFVHIVEKKPLEWLKKHKLFGQKMKDVEARMPSDTEVGDIYQRDTTSDKNKGLIDFHQHFEKYRNKEGGFSYRVTYLAGETIVHEIPKLEPNCYPFAIYYDFPQRKEFWGISTCQLILENQKIINQVESIIALIGTQLQNPQTIVNKYSGINPKEVAKYGSAPGYVWLSNIDPRLAMTWRQPPPIPQQLFDLARQAAENIREITGLTEAYMGQAVGSLQTSSGINSLIDRATLRDRDQMYDVEIFIEDLSRLIIKFMTTKYTEERFIRRETSPDQAITADNFIKFKGTDYAGIDFDFAIDVSAKAPVTRQRQKEEANQLMTLQGQYHFTPPIITPQEYMRFSEMADAERIIERMNRDEFNSNAQILQQVVTMANEAYQQGVSPEEVAKMSLEMLRQRMEQRDKGIGSANTGQRQLQQQGTS